MHFPDLTPPPVSPVPAALFSTALMFVLSALKDKSFLIEPTAGSPVFKNSDKCFLNSNQNQLECRESVAQHQLSIQRKDTDRSRKHHFHFFVVVLIPAEEFIDVVISICMTIFVLLGDIIQLNDD